MTAVAAVVLMPQGQACMMAAKDVYYQNAARSTAYEGYTWYPSRPHVAVKYRDLRHDAWYTHADGDISAYKRVYNPRSPVPSYEWVTYKHQQFVNVDDSPTYHLKNMSASPESGATAYGAQYQVCLTLPFQPDQRVSPGRYTN